MPETGRNLPEARRAFALAMARQSGRADPRYEQAFEAIRREDFLPPGPWRILRERDYIETPDDDPIHLYDNVLVALDAARGINNGEPFLHAAWIGAVAPAAGERVTQIGIGLGYYTAILATLVRGGGSVTAFEIDAALAEAAGRNLAAFDNVAVLAADATRAQLPPSDIIYVNAGVVAPPLAWIAALEPGGRLIFPWRPAPAIGLAVLVVRRSEGFSARAVMPSWFIPCAGASDEAATLAPPVSPAAAYAVASIWPTRERATDASAVAVYRDLWFSSAPLK